MAVRAFTITLPATTNYYNLYTQIIAVAGLSGIPSSVCQLRMSSDTVAASVSDSNYANVAGTPLAAAGVLDLRSERNAVDLKNIFVKGSAGVFSGIVVYM